MPPTAKRKRSKSSCTFLLQWWCGGSLWGVRAPVWSGMACWSLPSGEELVIQHSWSPLGLATTSLVHKFRMCFQAGSDIHTRWDTPPGSETTPSCGWCAHHARRSGRNWMILVPPRGRWHTGMWSLCRWHTVCRGPRSGSGCSTHRTLQMGGGGQNKTRRRLVLRNATGHGE